ncbi:hypothetical protein L596_019760 [Steinernema carpocapsae]|uniref:Uncharacterized protein n=1 Tax=Steinernema carpocapsae TaxID=34508 RepID=A0A4U5MRQ4_STECR|nr:hypothetical protein L596_019760 [Steinernema carpocapsae]
MLKPKPKMLQEVSPSILFPLFESGILEPTISPVRKFGSAVCYYEAEMSLAGMSANNFSFPGRNPKRLNWTLIIAAAVLSLALTTFNFTMNIEFADFGVDTVAEGINQQVIKKLTSMQHLALRIWNESPPVLMLLLSILLLSLVGVAMALGWILFALNLIQNSSVTTVVLHLIGVTGISINKFTNCLFYTRVVLEISPYLVDIILASTTKIELGSYIGPYGALGQSADMFVCTFVYFYMTTKHRRDGGGSH